MFLFLIVIFPIHIWGQSKQGLTLYSSILFTWQDSPLQGYDFTPGVNIGFINPQRIGDLIILKEGGYFNTWNQRTNNSFEGTYIGISSGGTIIKNLDITGGFRVWKEIEGTTMGLGVTFKILIFAPVSDRLSITSILDLWVNPIWGGSLGIGLTYSLKQRKSGRDHEKPPG